MAKLPTREHIAFGCYYDVRMTNHFEFTMKFVVKWYGWPFLMWKLTHENYSFRWYEYPRLIANITLYTIKQWLRGGEINAKRAKEH